MPLIDSGESMVDYDFTRQFKEYFSMTDEGSIKDPHNHDWMVWSITDIERWWGIFETNLAVPFGRKLFNSCCDEEEYQIHVNEIIKSGWFKKSGNLKRLSNRWNLFGWGRLNVESNLIMTKLPSSIASGFAVASIESFNKVRYKSEWKQINQTEILLELNRDINELPIAKKHTQLPWVCLKDSLANKSLDFELESRELGWSVEGEAMLILPVSLFSRLFYSTLGSNTSLGAEILDSWNVTGIESKFIKPLILASYSSYQLFLNSDKHVFAESVESWRNVISHYCKQWGWGNSSEISVDANSNSIEIKYRLHENLPFFIGQIMGIWERSHGRKPKVSLFFNDDDVDILIESLLDYI